MEDNNIKLLNICHSLVICICIVIIFANLAVCIGTLYNITALTSISSSYINIKINTAACFLLSGFALLLINNQNRGYFNHIIFAAISIIILLISSMTLIEYVSDVDLGIDQLLLKDIMPTSPGTLFPGRMTFITAINFILVAFTFLLLLSKSVSVWIIQTFAWSILLIAHISLSNYLSETDIHYSIVSHTTMALYTDILFMLLALGIFLLKPGSGIIQLILKNSSGGYLLRRLLPIIVLEPPLVNLIQKLFEKSGLIDPNFGYTINTTGSFIILGLVVLLLARMIDNKEKNISQVELEILKNEMIFRQFAENIDIVFYTTSPDLSEIRYVSPAYERIWGKSVESLYKNPKDWLESILPEDRKIANEVFFSGFKEENTSASAEYRIQRPDGAIRNIFGRIYKLKDNNNKVFCAIGIALDMTKARKEQLYTQLQFKLLQLTENEANIKELSHKFIQMICTSFDWEVGELWLLDNSKNVLRCVDIWHKDINTLIDFAIASRQYSFGFGEGFPGRVWKQKKPVYISDYTSTQAFSRSDAAQTAGLNYTFGIPIIYKNNVYGVLQLFSKNIINPDADFLALMENIGKILGEFILHIHNVGQLQDISRHDLLTGLLNRSAISEEIDNLISDGKSKSISVIVLDIDRFKLINEAFGHQFGDRLLNSLATKLNALINPANHTKINLARLGADKFILYISESNRDEAYDFACTINHTINNPIEVGEQKILLSMSIGIAIYPQNGHDSNTLITAADLALIQAKDLGGNRINFFTKELPLIATKAMAMDTDLRKAISNNQFFLEYQPQIDLKTGNICCVEALVRWQHPITGLISPGDFIPFAEKIGLMVTLNEHIMRMVFQQISSDWPGPPVSINISAQQFREGFHLVEYLESLMKEFSISSKLIELEITENMLFEDTEHDIAVLNALNGLGFQIAIDDFGTGFSALGYLNRIPVHKVKIDKSLITGLPDKVSNAKIVTGMIAMIHTLDMLVVAEGADSKTEVNFLIQKKCDIVQGFYYYKPMSFDALTAIINKSNVAKDID